jgi:hypothetical protein
MDLDMTDRLTVEQLMELDLLSRCRSGSAGVPMCPGTKTARDRLDRLYQSGQLPIGHPAEALRPLRQLHSGIAA